MIDILAERGREILAQVAWSNVLLAFDFDGTLAPIVETPIAARMRPATRARLAALARCYPVAVISGRSQRDVVRRLDGVSVAAVVGNHGLEPGGDLRTYADQARAWLASLASRLAHHAGVEIEDKHYSVAVHYRKSRAKRAVRAAIRAELEALGDAARVVGGKAVFNVVPRGAPHKGIALQRLRRQLHTDVALFVGDDVTDEDVFALDEPGRLFSIRVGRSLRTRAPYFIARQQRIDALLDRLLALRPEADHRRREEA